MANGPLTRVAQKQVQAHLYDNVGKDVKKITRTKKEPEDSLWNFSLRYWAQLDYFGVDGKGIDNQWLVSVLERLKTLSAEPVERVYRDIAMREALRFHPINWQATNIPIAKKDIQGLPLHCYDNPEFELHQFQISKGKGRIVGFFDENWVFNIVLLDPLHNLQPSRSFNYVVDHCKPLSSEITSLCEAIKDSVAGCKTTNCQTAQKVVALAEGHEKYAEKFDILMVQLKHPSHMEWAKELVAKGHASSFADIFDTGLLCTADTAPGLLPDPIKRS